MWTNFTGLPALSSDIEALTLFQVKPFYQMEYWQPLGCDRISDPAEAIAIFDMGVLFGVQTIIFMVQQAINLCGGQVGVDGIMGTETLAALRQLTRENFLLAFHQILMHRIENIIKKNPKVSRFRGGWVNRVDRLLTLDGAAAFNITTT